MGKVQKATEEMSYAWHRSEDSNGYLYHSLNDTSKCIINASCCGAFNRKSAKEARDLIADLAKCNMKAPSESLGSNNRTRGSGVIDLNKMTAMEAKLDTIMHRMDK